MTPEQYARIRPLFDHAMALPVSERRRFVEGNTPPGDPLQADLLAMVEAGDDSHFLASASLPGILAGATDDRDLPTQIGHYKILRELGRGGMGVVYLALRNDDVFHKVVALKVIGGGSATQTDFVQRFKQERQILAGLDHPNIARILDGGNTEDGRPFYVMEYVEGLPLDRYCDRVQADAPTRVKLVLQVCDALDYLHGHSVVHRDIKPGNILVAPEGQVKLLDFGIARIQSADLVHGAPPAGTPTLIVTPGYASPEQIAGDRAGIAADVYSLGVVLYQLITGRLPFADAEGRADLKRQLASLVPKPPSQELDTARKTGPGTTTILRRAIGADLDRIVLTSLHRQPSQRYTSIRLFADDLRRYLEGRPIAARHESWPYAFQLLVRRNMVAATLAVLLLASAALGAVIAVRATIDRVRLDSKTSEVERLVALLNTRVERWREVSDPVPPSEKTADVQVASQVMASDTMRSLAERTPDPPRLKRVVAELRRFLDNADTLSAEQPLVRKEISRVYQQVGDFESNAPRPQVADRPQAVESYKRAARIAASVGAGDPAWVQTQLAQLARRLQALGAPADIVALAAPPAPVAAAQAPAVPVPVPVVSRPPKKRASTQPVDEAAYAEVSDRLRTTAATAQRARGNLEALRMRLAAQGQTVRPDLLSSIAQVDALVGQAKDLMAENDLAGAEDALRRAAYELRRLTQAVGS